MNELKQSAVMCSQCGQRQALLDINGAPVCIACEHTFQQSRYMVFAQNAAMMNHASQELDAVLGFGPLSPQIVIPKAPVPPIYYNSQSVNVQGSSVGNINMGAARDIQANVKTLTQNGDIAIAEKLAELGNAILNAEDVDDAVKNELLEQFSVLTEMASAKPEDRKPGAIKAIISAVTEGAKAIGGVAAAWSAAEPLLKGHFGM